MIDICRHGQTVYNAAGRYQGQVDSPLTALGRAQAGAMGQTLARRVGPGLKVWVRPLGRAQETLARILQETGPAEVVCDPRLREVGMGAWDGMSEVEIEAEYPGARDGLAPGAWFFHGPGGETFDTFAARVAGAMAQVVADPAPVRLVVAHGVVSRVIRGQHAGLSRAQTLTLPVPQDAFHALEADGLVGVVACQVAGGCGGRA